MGSELHVFSLSSSATKTYSRRRDKMLTSSVDFSNQTKELTAKEDPTQKEVGLGSIRTDLDGIDSMTVKELRTLSSSMGISTRGSKKDLVTTLRSFSACMNDDMGTAALVNEVLSDTQSPLSKEAPPKRKAKQSIDKNIGSPTVDSGAANKMQRRSRRKKQFADSVISEDNSRIVLMEEKLSDEEEAIDKKSSHLKKRVSTKVIKEVRVLNNVDNEVNISEPWTMLAHKKPQHGWVAYNPKTMRPPPLTGDIKYLKLMSWNVNGLRALLKIDSLSAVQQREDFDVLCLQETKLQEKDVEEIKQMLFDGYKNSYWTCSISKLGYSGTAIISKIKPMSVRYGLGIHDHDTEGRLVTAEFDKFYLVSGYVPNSGDGLRRLPYRINEWDPSLGKHLKELEKSKPVILTGDLNCAHEEIDIYNPAGNRRSAGFTDEERKSFELNFLSRGFVDTFRMQHPGVVGYTYYGYRHGGRKTNKGWRLDYFLVSESIAEKVYDSYIVPDILGSDHCPIGLILKQ